MRAALEVGSSSMLIDFCSLCNSRAFLGFGFVFFGFLGCGGLLPTPLNLSAHGSAGRSCIAR